MAAIAANPAGNEFNGVVNNSCLRYEVTINEGAPRELNPGQRLKFSDFFPPEAELIPSYLRLKVSYKGREIEQRTCLDKYSYVALLGKKPNEANVKVYFNENRDAPPSPPEEILRLVGERINQHLAGTGSQSFHGGCRPENMVFSTFFCYNQDLWHNGFMRARYIAPVYEQCTGQKVSPDELRQVYDNKSLF